MLKGSETYPTFLGIGAQKCGTSWLARMLRQHPQIALSVKKELNYFNHVANYRKGADWYRGNFSVAPESRAIGEFSPNYFWTTKYFENDREGVALQNEEVPRLVHELLPDLKLVVSLRDPVDRAVSSYFHQIRSGNVKPGERILDVAHLHGIESMGYYDIHLENWLKYYPLDRILVLWYESDIRDDRSKRATLRRTFRHLDVDDSFEPTGLNDKVNAKRPDFDVRVNHMPFPDAVRRFIKRRVPKFVKERSLWKIDVAAGERAKLKERYLPHMERMSLLLGEQHPWQQ
ncbi:sulfotransferase domain-containing protein [Thiocapsa bogorovii]|uniref:sulfotransferase domain-containing protein n=1 Tax=Thiocapsa bogorovii TaxID=521689 RepID=UPI001E3521DB|nr:sulfotransferase domain-containing protein [Thiocapsa bogorovii]UHD17096.1 sulfotransferase domain-containing protein [Thiocapsa bogorovii]